MGISMKLFGLRDNAFGTCVITSVGMLGYEHAFVPLPPYSNVPLIVTIGTIVKKPLVVENEIKIRDVINITLTLDHRYTDGARAAKVYQKFIKYLDDPVTCPKESAV
eukprot:TRINITY_DN7820_c0_g1_i6.p2 TRINITY_DN7820_c0_g1~~TRINITY_DN7820_c0_g1_i6.p2  ORF type:complete len:107 (+),score=16.33 TRINITY_DN7820_c0_g1_i6:758-1078(+)